LANIRSAKNIQSLKNLESTFDRKTKLRNEIAKTNSVKFELAQKKILSSVVMNPIDNVNESEQILMKRITMSDLKEYIKTKPLSNKNKKVFMDQVGRPSANLNAIRKNVNNNKKRKILNSFVNASNRVDKKQRVDTSRKRKTLNSFIEASDRVEKKQKQEVVKNVKSSTLS